MTGLMDINERYASLLVENDLTLKTALINSRSQNVFFAKDKKTALSMRQYQSDIEKGENSIIRAGVMQGDTITQPTTKTASDTITHIIEAQQYLKAS